MKGENKISGTLDLTFLIYLGIGYIVISVNRKHYLRILPYDSKYFKRIITPFTHRITLLIIYFIFFPYQKKIKLNKYPTKNGNKIYPKRQV